MNIEDSISLCSTVDDLPEDLQSKLSFRDDSSSLGSDSEINGAAPYRKTDKYGFIGSGASEEAWQPPLEVIRHREMKWLEMISLWEKTMARRYSKVKVLCRKGIPSSLRARIWPLLCGGLAEMQKNKNKYEELDQAPGDKQWVDTIEKDIHRQFPFHEMFLSPEGHGQKGLLRVLKAYTVYKPEEGYCQAQGPVAAVLLMQMPAEQAFWCLAQISEKYLPKYYSPGLEGVQLDGQVFVALLKKTCPVAYRHLKKQNVDPMLYLTEWFLCIYSRTLPFPTLLRIWDIFFSEGVKVLFRVALLLVKIALGSPEKVKECNELVDTLEKLRTIPPQLLQEEFVVHEVCNMTISERDIKRECLIQQHKLRKRNIEMKYDPRCRLHGSKAVWDTQQEAALVRAPSEVNRTNIQIPSIVIVDTSEISEKKTREERRREKEEAKEHQRLEKQKQKEEKERLRALERQQKLEKLKEDGKKPPKATMSKTFQMNRKSVIPIRETEDNSEQIEKTKASRRGSAPFLETYF
ncbi:carabin-like [Protopterus annectens]|uniref:carabin-like n=1 Tax=Protopterus annectens TaxID=7888 RepID=UPI001CFA7AD0|nr:carabin-like [Protopterus annectens]